MSTYGGMTALITGGASGIGLATAEHLRELGATVAVLDRAPDGPPGLIYVQADITDDAQVRTAVTGAIAELGALDVLVNCAGIGAVGQVEDNPDDEWRHVLDVDVIGIARVTRAALPALRRSERGAIVNVASIVATTGLPNRALYSAAKGAVLALTRAMAADLLPAGIRVNAISPGTADTPWVGRLLDASADPVAERRALEARQPSGRLVTAEEVAAGIAYLVSPLARSTTGTCLDVDGGLTGLRLPPR